MPFLSVATGLIVGILLGKIAEYYTSDEYGKVKEIASESQTGHATNIIAGFSVGMESTMLTVLALVGGIILSYCFLECMGSRLVQLECFLLAALQCLLTPMVRFRIMRAVLRNGRAGSRCS